VKVCVVGNPCNTNALTAALSAPTIPEENFTAMTRLDENRSKGYLAKKFGVSASKIEKMIILGNHSNTMYPFLEVTRINGEPVVLSAEERTEFE
jgi:malate/lactate dehydrogenase